MPLYTFTCSDCSTEFEAFIPRPTATPTATCPRCDGSNVTKQFGVPARGPALAPAPTNCRGDGPPCGAATCGRARLGLPE